MRWLVGLALFALGGLAPGQGKRVLVVTHAAGYVHEVTPHAERVISRLAQEDGRVRLEFCRTAAEVRSRITPKGLRAVDAVVLLNTSGNLPIADLGWFLRWVQQGKGLAAVHGGAATYWPKERGDRRFGRFLGGTFRGHGLLGETTVKLEGVSEGSVRVLDEMYLFEEPGASIRKRFKVLISIDRHPQDRSPRAGSAGDFPLAWQGWRGKGRLFVTTLGHTQRTWDEPVFWRHVWRGVLWAAGVRLAATALDNGRRWRDHG